MGLFWVVVMASINISLPESMKAFIEEQVASSGYGTVSEYVRDLIRQDQRRKHKEQLEAFLLEGLESGSATPMTSSDWDAIRKAVLDTIAQRQQGQGDG